MPSITDYGSLYVELEKGLRKEKWFTKRWQSTAGFFPDEAAPKSVFIQVFRDSWFNADGKGIHFESWMTTADVKRGTANVVLHVESSRERTGINGKILVKNLLESAGAQIGAWEGYQIKESYTMQPFIRKMDVTPEGFVEELTEEFRRLAGLADAVDRAIEVARTPA